MEAKSGGVYAKIHAPSVRHNRSGSGRFKDITVMRDQALAEAAQMDAEIKANRFRSPLHGIPIAMKDNIDTAGTRTTAASARCGAARVSSGTLPQKCTAVFPWCSSEPRYGNQEHERYRRTALFRESD